MTFDTQGQIENWRIVSQGLRLTQINSEEENDGWYEAVRITSENHPEFYRTQPMVASGTTPTVFDTQALVLAPSAIYWDYLKALALPEMPGYHSGQLKQLKDIEFKLQHQYGVCKPNTIQLVENIENDSQRSVGSTVGGKTYPGGYVVNLLPKDDGLELQRMAISNNFDVVYLRVYGRTSGNRSKFIAEGIQNVEFQFQANSDLATFHTANQKDPKLEMMIDAVNDNPTTKMRRTGM
jgi:hypothetical protein